MDIRTGIGYDMHVFREGSYVTLGGVRIAHERGIEAHSDGDMVLHALTDAVLGALALGDIGDHFPPSDARWRDATSDIFMRHAIALGLARGYRLANCDLTIIAEAPKIGPHRAAIANEIARICAIDVDRVSVKATTNEGVGFVGRREGIATIASALMIKE